MKTKKFILVLSLLLMFSGIGIIGWLGLSQTVLPAWQPASLMFNDGVDHLVGQAVDIVDDQGKVISRACRVNVGDEIINAKGNHYRVIKVDRHKAVVKSLGQDKQFLAWQEFYTDERLAMAAANPKGGTVGIYHTHSDEAYVPSDGKESIPFKGGIYDVGKSLVSRLKQKSATRVVYDQTPHDPHDNAAYQRSRRTAMKLMKQNPIAIIDVHRDGIPDAGYYKANVSGNQVSQLRLVVGRQNPNMEANKDFARRMMAYANKVHPNIVKEIFMAKGNYNQDLMPTAILIEAGTHTNTKGEAERGVALFADAIPTVLGIEGGPQTRNVPGGGLTQPGAGGAGGWRAVGWILGITLLLGGGFLLISAGSLKGVGNRLAGLGKEFTNYLGPLVVKKPQPQKHKTKAKAGRTVYDELADRASVDRRDDVTED
ncbi:stage II sporulation protein P [Desulforamulus hydrothermalis]|uniref:Stage II sporulation P family protein n=1 Tax=Desulforamulus hydrothermalis Lam5 = DSM 18033 TaxID=1121428 RepID=K8EKE1_9FIRM|nr:stage II sporulation protein P [Desulforamulus hydrothermalis]CCO09021.1 Stage II sporulation P family protein [Desulforamulus hydrothermalis Lam5 = DSM 18033]SHG77130.1 stage II sporulation protein P [Desulforamulus hydrothermalis Lam5 = DSM 18033]